jgi:hypothetical protein
MRAHLGSTLKGILHENQNQNPQYHQVSFFNFKSKLRNKLDCNSYPIVTKTKQNQTLPKHNYMTLIANNKPNANN